MLKKILGMLRTKIERKSAPMLPIKLRGFFETLLDTLVGPGPHVNLLCRKFSRAVACVWRVARYFFYI